MSNMYSAVHGDSTHRQNPHNFYLGNRNEETVTNYEQYCIYNSRPLHPQAVTPGTMFNQRAGFPSNPSWSVNNTNIASTLIDQIQAKNILLVKNKDVMEKQSTYIAKLEKQLDERNSNDLLRKLQDRERDVEHLRARLEAETAPKYEVEKLRRNLGDAEYELEKFEKVLQETLNEKSAEAKKYQDLINAKDLELEKTKREIKRLAEEKSELTMRIENLDKYVGDLPTSDEFRKLRNKSKHWKHLCCKLQEQIKEKEEKFTSGRKDLEEKALNADRFERENFDLRRMVKSLQDKMKNDDAHSKALELEHVMFENERLQADIEKMEKLINEKQRKQKQFYLQSQESQKKLEQRLSQEEDTVAALREEISKKELNISELKSSMKQLSSQCQNLVEEKLDINDKLKKMQIINTKETVETNRKIYKQLRRNVNKLKDIMRLYQQRKEGRDLELSLLLGTAGAGDSLRNHDEQLLTEEVNELSKDIDEFQTFLTDQYAEELANNLEGNCTMQ